jgi:uncharacterized protein (TIGR02598 family)
MCQIFYVYYHVRGLTNPLAEFKKRIVRHPSKSTQTRSHRNQSGFSLIEVLLAVGIVAMAFIPLLGLLPTGMSAMHAAADQTVTSQIVQRVAGEFQQADFDGIDSSSDLRYFDEEAVELGPSQSSKIIYQSRWVVLMDASQPHLKRILVQVARNPGGSLALREETFQGAKIWSRTNNLPVTTRSILLARISTQQ